METYLKNDAELQNILLNGYYHLKDITLNVNYVNSLATDEVYDYKKNNSLDHKMCIRDSIKATIISLSEKLAYYLKDGARVHIEGIGYFHISLTCPETRTPSSTRANKVKFKSVTFRADKYLKHQLSDVKTERSKYKPQMCIRDRFIIL